MCSAHGLHIELNVIDSAYSDIVGTPDEQEATKIDRRSRLTDRSAWPNPLLTIRYNSIEDEAEWWDTHDSGEYDEEFVPVELTVAPELRRNKPEVAAANPEDPLRRPCRGINARPPQGGATRVIRF